MPRFPRSAPQVPVEPAEEALFESLEVTAAENISAEDFGRKAAREALQACLKFAHDRGLSGQALKILADLIEALDDVDRGVLPEIFDPQACKRAGATGRKQWSRSTAARQVPLYAAALLGTLLQKGIPRPEAAAKVARAAQKWPRHSAGVIKASTVINWRDEFLQAGPSSPQRQSYNATVKMLSEGPRSVEIFAGILQDGPPFTAAKRKMRK